MITIKLPYNSTDKFYSKLFDLRRQYSICVRFIYNRLIDEKIDTKELYQYCKSTINNIPDMNSFFLLSAINEAKQLYKRFGTKDETKHIIFGGRSNLSRYNRGKINKETYKNNKLLPFNILADELKNGNRHFKLNIINENFIEFKLNAKEHFILHLPKLRPNIRKQLYKLQNLNEGKQGDKGYGYSIKLTEKYIYISFDEFKNEIINQYQENRYLGIDMNPDNIGISICEYINNENKIIHTQQFNFSEIIDKTFNLNKASNHTDSKYWNNKLNFEIYQISKKISNLSSQYNCKYIFIEELKFDQKKQRIKKTIKSKNFNRLTKNSWKRNKFIENLEKRCNINNQKLIKVNASYSSIIGNLQYDYVDSINASIEIARRGYECRILRNRDKYHPAVKLKDTILHQWKEMGSVIPGNWKDVYSKIKNMGIKYRVSLRECSRSVFSMDNTRSRVNVYLFE